MLVYWTLACATDLLHVLCMLAWGLGLPLLVWHRYPRLSRAYTWFALSFVLISVASHLVLGECVLTTLARIFWTAAGEYRAGSSFTSLLVNRVAGLHPTQREVVLLWEASVVVTAVGSLWCWRGTARHARSLHVARTLHR